MSSALSSLRGRAPRLLAIDLTADDQVEIAHLAPEIAEDVRRWIELLAGVRPPVQDSLLRVAGAMGVSPRTARRKYDAALRNGWRGLVDRTREPGPRRWTVAPETREHFAKLAALNQRSSAQAYDLLLRQFFACEPIPGVSDDQPRNRLPRGWSRRAFYEHLPTPYELRSFRIGRAAASDLGPMVYSDRAQLWVGSHYLLDDLVHDQFVNVLDRALKGRPVEFHALDLYSACKFAWGVRVKTMDQITGRMTNLRAENTAALLVSIFTGHGYHAERGTVIVAEHGTTGVPERIEEILSDATSGRIRVNRSGIQDTVAFVGQWGGKGGGNPRFKAALESTGNLYHNMLGFGAGQTGLSVDRRPEELSGLLDADDVLMQAFVALAEREPELAAQLRLPVLSDRQYLDLLVRIYHLANSRTRHRLQGWDLMVRPDEGDPTRVRRMSPLEVYQRGRGELTRLPAAIAARVLYHASARERTVRRTIIEFQDSELSSDPLRFDASRWREGDKFQAVLNPFDPSALYLFDARARYVGLAPRLLPVNPADEQALAREFGRRNRVLKTLLDPIARLGREITEQRIADTTHNIAVLSESAVARAATPEAKARRAGAAIAASDPFRPEDPGVAITEDVEAVEAVEESVDFEEVQTHTTGAK